MTIPPHLRAVLRRLFPAPGSLSAGDALWLRLLGTAAAAVALTVALGLAGLTERLEWEQIRLLAGNPFYMDATAVQVSLLSPGAMLLLCVAVALYLSAVLLHERRALWRFSIMIPALTALALPGLLCLFWGGVLNMAPPLLTALLCWLGVELQEWRRRRRVQG